MTLFLQQPSQQILATLTLAVSVRIHMKRKVNSNLKNIGEQKPKE